MRDRVCFSLTQSQSGFEPGPLDSILEFRLDTWADTSFTDAINAARQPVIATFRSDAHGGTANRADRDGRGWQWRAQVAGQTADWIDLESDEADLASRIHEVRARGAKVLLSHHALEPGDPFPSTPEFEEATQLADVVKVIGTGGGAAAIHDQINAYQRWLGPPLIHFYMGSEVQATRWLALVYGAPFTFVAPTDAAATAPGQLCLADLEHVETRALSLDSDLFAVCGDPIGHSRSPGYHQPKLGAGFHAPLFLRLPARSQSDLRQYLDRFDRLVGLAITKPVKEAAHCLAEYYGSQAVEYMGAVNTLVRVGRRLVADNTDYAALVELIAGMGHINRARVLGYGGLGKSCVAALRTLGIRTEVTNRSADRLRGLDDDVSILPWERRNEPGVDLIVQATSVGMDGRTSPMDAIPDGVGWLIESIYHPSKTPLIEMATDAHVSIIDGSLLFETQARIQNALFQSAGRRP